MRMVVSSCDLLSRVYPNTQTKSVGTDSSYLVRTWARWYNNIHLSVFQLLDHTVFYCGICVSTNYYTMQLFIHLHAVLAWNRITSIHNIRFPKWIKGNAGWVQHHNRQSSQRHGLKKAKETNEKHVSESGLKAAQDAGMYFVVPSPASCRTIMTTSATFPFAPGLAADQPACCK